MTVSGDDAIQAAAERAESTRARNLPPYGELPELPIPADTANLREGPNLHDACLALLPLVGVWQGEGEVNYPTIEGPRRLVQRVTISHDGRPFLHHEARSWLLDDDGNVIRPAARETGWWRPQPDDSLELLLAHNTGIIELFYGATGGQTSWELGTDAVVRSASAKEVTGAKRLYGIVNNGDLGYVEERAMVGEPMQPHVSVYLHRVAG
ncbi:FABP family protein [Amycolatopsis nigrescens]|uniref:FABP family protein n=1 Tax=Amycolatopsis nigrescens TaxID=381445 RepID=UPI0003654AA4|nr:FABP family protein [Amycolatopsis nigrescens]